MLSSLLLGGVLALGQRPYFRAPSTPSPLQTAAYETDAERTERAEAIAVGWRPARKVDTPNGDSGSEPVNLSVTVPPALAPVAPTSPPASAPPTRYALMSGAQGTWLGAALEQNRLSVYGWTEFSYSAGTASQNNFPVAFNDRAGELLMNQNYLHFERTIDASKNECQWGFVTETILPGTDYRFTLPRGLFNGQLTENGGGPNLYGIDPYQFYAQSFLPDLGPRGTKVVVGRFATHVGYEVVQAPDSPFLSKSYLFLVNPFTHTGVWATSQLTDDWSVGNGIATGSDTFIDPANRPTYLGQLKWAPPKGRASVLFNAVVTDPTYDEKEAFAFYNVYDLIVNYKISDRASYALDATYSNIRGVPNIGATDWYGAANYWIYQFPNNLSGTIRAEAFKDTSGFRTGSPGWYTELTAGVAWKPVPSLVIRPSVRYDRNWESQPFEGEPDLFTTTIDVIVRW